MKEEDKKSKIAAMQQTITFFEKLLRASTDGILITDATHNIIVVNEAFCGYFGQQRHEVIETNLLCWLEQVDTHGTRRWIELVNHIHNKGYSRDVEFRFMTQTQGIKYLNVNASLLEQVATEEIGVIISIWRDSTELKNKEESLRQTKDYAENLIETANVIVVGLDVMGNIRVFNKAASDITGYKKAEIIDKNWFEVIALKDRDPIFWEEFVKWQTSGQLSKTFETLILTKSGMKKYISWQNSVIREKEHVAGTISFGIDITEQKQARALIEQMHLVTFVKDVGIALTKGNTLHEILHHCAEAIVNHLDAAFARIWTVNEKSGMMELQASAGMYTHLDGPHSRIPVGKFKIGRIAQERKPHLTNSVTVDPSISHKDWAKQEGMVAFAGYPLLTGDHLAGVVAMFARKELSQHTLRALASVADIIALGITHKEDEEKLRKSEKRFRTIFDSANDGILMADIETKKFHTGNKKICQMLGYTQEEIKDILVTDIHPREFLPYVLKQFKKHAKREDTRAVDIPVKRKDGSVFFADINTSRITFAGNIYLMGIFRDVTERRQTEEKMRHLAFHDALTALPNRILFNDRLNLALAHSHRTKEMLAVLFLDLDRFKVINDTLGHSMGDQLLQGVGDRLKNCLREDDTIARLGGDEFALLLPGIIHEEDVVNIARKIIKIIKQPWTIGEHKLYITASIGIVRYPYDGNDAETLLKNADTAMYHAKEQGRNNYQFYTTSMHAKSFEKMMMESSLRHALEHEEFIVHYQPIITISSGKIAGMEALVRWQHPEYGLISPGEFLPMAEEIRLIVAIDELVLRTACKQNKTWLNAGFHLEYVAVNLSAHTFQQHNILEIITSVLQETKLDPHFLGLEITEGIAMQDIDTTIYKLSKLRELGIQIAIDDFGTGFSSLSYLKRFPVNKLKICPQFVSNIATNHKDMMIVSSIIALAQGLQFKVVAEGVETKEQFSLLKQLECDDLQGYLFCKPLPADVIEKTLWHDHLRRDSWHRKLSLFFPEKNVEHGNDVVVVKE
jgi:diguanylate cyclase (GGDEF)-like protein/PAS domain S-box-containing protein